MQEPRGFDGKQEWKTVRQLSEPRNSDLANMETAASEPLPPDQGADTVEKGQETGNPDLKSPRGVDRKDKTGRTESRQSTDLDYISGEKRSRSRGGFELGNRRDSSSHLSYGSLEISSRRRREESWSSDTSNSRYTRGELNYDSRLSESSSPGSGSRSRSRHGNKRRRESESPTTGAKRTDDR